MEEDRIQSVKNWPELKSIREIQIFVGFANFYRRFIKGFSRIAAPLTELTKMSPSKRDVDSHARVVSNVQRSADVAFGGTVQRDTNIASRGTLDTDSHARVVFNVQRDAIVVSRGTKTNEKSSKSSFILTPEAKKAFKDLKAAFTTAPVLRHFNPELPIRVENNTSDYAIGGILSQLHSEVWHPVAYCSRKQIPAETRYDTHDKELLAIVESFKHWRHYCEGSRHKTQVLTDHHNIKRFMSTTRLNSRQIR